MGNKLLNEKEVAEQIGMSVHWLRRMRITGGGIPFLKMGNGAKAGVRYEVDAVEAFKRSRVRTSTSTY
ncbi:helix-turn-helix domain-containing protein [Geomonas sp. Red69]|uniref:helix-turn-helix transcriptional regulator n=1 Tax=Geomonas diazotrophica TaxID=2843197 RepID=UPI001C11137E|nr:helix-turn-helix domain-containing protein [Geomonas diazotrophica]MBU5635502.1 helix-turn-helix domain-containing protein [Geomonas diazotrophica]